MAGASDDDRNLTFEYTLPPGYYGPVTGIGAPVSMRGRRVGKVQQIEDDGEQVMVTIAFDGRYGKELFERIQGTSSISFD